MIESKKFVIGFIFIAFFFFGAFWVINQAPQNSFVDTSVENIKFVKIAGQDIKVELAITPEEKMQGLSGRQSLSAEDGLLFIFEESGKYSFWMKDMNFMIDIIWIAQDLQVVHIQKDASPESYPATFTPAQDAKYVLEVAAGFAEKNTLKVGDSVIFTY